MSSALPGSWSLGSNPSSMACPFELVGFLLFFFFLVYFLFVFNYLCLSILIYKMGMMDCLLTLEELDVLLQAKHLQGYMPHKHSLMPRSKDSMFYKNNFLHVMLFWLGLWLLKNSILARLTKKQKRLWEKRSLLVLLHGSKLSCWRRQ